MLNGAGTSTNIFNGITIPNGNTLNVKSGYNVNSGNELIIETGGGYAGLYVSGGSFVASGLFSFPHNNSTFATCYIEVSGGTLNPAIMNFARNPAGIGLLHVYSGTLNAGAVSMPYGASGTGVWYQVGGAAVATSFTIGNNAAGTGRGELNMAGGTLSLGTANLTCGTNVPPVINLNGGMLTAASIAGANNSATLNFNGGTLQASGNKASFIVVSNAYVYGNGALIDDNSYVITNAQSLLAPSGYGVASLPAIGAMSGYNGAPHVVLTGGSGDGATAVALFNSNDGSVTGLVVTCSGRGYGSGDTVSVTLLGGGIASTTLVSKATMGPVASGGLTKIGSGRLTLSGTNTYTGVTTVSNGTLVVSSTNALKNTTGIVLVGGTLLATNVPGAFHITSNSTVSVIAGSSFLVTNLVVDAGAAISPGGPSAIATNTFGTASSHTLAINGTYEVNVSNDGSGRCDLIQAAGNLDLNGMKISFPGAVAYDQGVDYVIATCSNTLTQTALSIKEESQQGKWVLRYNTLTTPKQVILRRASAGAMLIVY